MIPFTGAVFVWAISNTLWWSHSLETSSGRGQEEGGGGGRVV